MTVLALHALRADTVIYDALVSEEILALANENAELIYAGKRGGKPSPKQHDISHKLIGLAREGRRVLRLKGGDPSSSAGAAKKPWRWWRPVWTSASSWCFRRIGGLAYAGIPLTHRDTNSAVTFVTGHNASGIVPDSVDWQSVAKGLMPWSFMPLKHITQISKMLINAGRSSDEPAAVVSKATMAEQQTVVSTLANIATDAASAALSPPAMLIVGDVVRLRKD